MNNPLLAQLRTDHQHFRRLMDLLEESLDHPSGGIPDFDLMREIMRYMVHYSDRFHHPLEDRLFARLVRREAGVERELEAMHADHESIPRTGQALLDTLSADPEQATMTWQAIDGLARDYIERLRRHKDQEESKLFPLAEALLTEADVEAVRAEIEWLEDPVFGPALKAGYQVLYDRLDRG